MLYCYLLNAATCYIAIYQILPYVILLFIENCRMLYCYLLHIYCQMLYCYLLNTATCYIAIY